MSAEAPWAEQANPCPETPFCEDPLLPFRNKEAQESCPVAKLWGPVPPRVLAGWAFGGRESWTNFGP